MATKYEQAREAIRQAIVTGRFVPGDRLPSVRELMQIHGVSYSTITRSLRELRDGGLIEHHWGKGIFVAAGAADAEVRHVAIVFQDIFETTEPPYVDVLRGVDRAVAAAGLQMHLFPLRDGGVTALQEHHPLMSLIRHRRIHAALCLSADPPALVERLCGSGIPVVTVGNRYPRAGAGCVTFDTQQIARLVAQHLLDARGHRDLRLILGPQADSARLVRPSNELGPAVAAEAAERGLPLPRGATVHCDYTLRSVQPVLCRWLDGSDEPLAIFVSDGRLARDVVRLSEQLCPDPARRPYVVGLASESEEADFPHVEVPLAAIGTKAIALVDDMIVGSSPRTETLTSRLILPASRPAG